jgi:hypothetical protein
MSNWPRNHRNVFGLVDGVRNLDKISSTLGLPSPLVLQILHDLLSLGVIVLDA